jgi:succinate dehydrogenase / fumarate reductase cytochrome b subunit
MSAVAASGVLARGANFYGTTLGKKVVMAVTGIILFGFLIGHMLGNLQFFAGPEKLNAYAENLRALGPLLWAVRIGLLIATLLHIQAAAALWRLQKLARPVAYSRRQNVGSNYAARTMYWSGPIVLAFLIYHLLHFTIGAAHPNFRDLRPYENVVIGFSNPIVSIAYVVAMVLLGMHLYHGLWSMFQTIGFAHPRYTPKLKAFAKLFTVVLVAGFLAVPIAVLAGMRPGRDIL